MPRSASLSASAALSAPGVAAQRRSAARATDAGTEPTPLPTPSLAASRAGAAERRRRRRDRRRARVGGREREHAQQHHHEAAVLVGRERDLGAAGQDHAVEKLRLVGGQQRGEAARDLAVGIVVGERARHRLHDRHLLQQRRHLLERAGGGEAELAQAVDGADQRRAVARRRRLDAARRVAAIDGAEHLAHGRFLDAAAAVGDRLVGERLGVAHRAARGARDQLQRARLGGDVLGREDRRRGGATIVSGAIGRRLNWRQRDSTVAGTFCGSVVARMNLR